MTEMSDELPIDEDERGEKADNFRGILDEKMDDPKYPRGSLELPVSDKHAMASGTGSHGDNLDVKSPTQDEERAEISSSLMAVITSGLKANDNPPPGSLVIGELGGSVSGIVEVVPQAKSFNEMSEDELFVELEQREREFGLDDERTIEVVDYLGDMFISSGRYPDAEPHLKRSLAHCKKSRGQADEKALSLSRVYVACLMHQNKNRETILYLKNFLGWCAKELGVASLEGLDAKKNMALCLAKLGKDSEAAITFREVLGSLEAQPDSDSSLLLVEIKKNLAVVERRQGNRAAAETLLEDLLGYMKSQFAPDHEDILAAMRDLAVLKGELDKPAESLALFRTALVISEKRNGLAHEETALTLENIVRLLIANDVRDEAVLLEAQAAGSKLLEARRNSSGENSVGTLQILADLALIQRRLGRLTEAESMYRQTLSTCESSIGSDNKTASVIMKGLADCVMEQESDIPPLLSDGKRLGAAGELYRKVLSVRKKTLGPTHEDTMAVTNNLASVLYAQGSLIDAIELQERGHNACRRGLGKDAPATLHAAVQLCKTYNKAGHYSDAESLLDQVVETRKDTLGVGHRDTIEATIELGNTYTGLKQYLRAKEVFLHVSGEMDKNAESFPATDPLRQQFQCGIGILSVKSKDFEAGLRAMNQCLAGMRSSLGAANGELLATVSKFSHVLVDVQKYQEASHLLSESLKHLIDAVGTQHPGAAELSFELGCIQADYLKDFEAAHNSIKQAVEVFTVSLGESHKLTVQAMQRLGTLQGNQAGQ